MTCCIINKGVIILPKYYGRHAATTPFKHLISVRNGLLLERAVRAAHGGTRVAAKARAICRLSHPTISSARCFRYFTVDYSRSRRGSSSQTQSRIWDARAGWLLAQTFDARKSRAASAPCGVALRLHRAKQGWFLFTIRPAVATPTICTEPGTATASSFSGHLLTGDVGLIRHADPVGKQSPMSRLRKTGIQ